ncbi:hypothetical protein ABID22_000333 [Pontibacter aydingkolensis]|uniref:Uncharacterized protein n=1 Tax=Pontibacter aydingkolensis TaxID=1911536 RepID=A0ABS7CR53_9BACT|nr:hypothetical protein [Pontibacter aydingkolensis]MBW7466002.1 hypothetical protein [Pontibacter aydingkolensis]
MNDYYIEDNENSLTIKYEWHGSDRPYSIPKWELGRTRGRESEWLMQLLYKPWASRAMLYDVAQYIIRYNPDNDIDWESTYAIVNSHFRD